MPARPLDSKRHFRFALKWRSFTATWRAKTRSGSSAGSGIGVESASRYIRAEGVSGAGSGQLFWSIGRQLEVFLDTVSPEVADLRTQLEQGSFAATATRGYEAFSSNPKLVRFVDPESALSASIVLNLAPEHVRLFLEEVRRTLTLFDRYEISMGQFFHEVRGALYETPLLDPFDDLCSVLAREFRKATEPLAREAPPFAHVGSALLPDKPRDYVWQFNAVRNRDITFEFLDDFDILGTSTRAISGVPFHHLANAIEVLHRISRHIESADGMRTLTSNRE